MPDSGYGRLQHFRAHRASSTSPSPPPPPHPPVVADWVGRLSTSSSSAAASSAHAHQLPPRSASPATAAAAAADDIFRLREENAALRARVAEVEQREEARLSEARRTTEEELLERVEASFQRYREEAETELEAARREAARARGRVEALQQALQEEETEPAPATYASSLSPQHAAALHAASPARSNSSGGAAATSPTSLDARTHRISEDLLSVLLTLQDSSENDPDALYDNVHKAVKQTFRTLLTEHEAEVRHLQDVHEKEAASVGRRARITTPPCFASLMRSGSGGGGDGAAAASAVAQSLRREAEAAKEDLEQERQRVAMVCIHMKKSLHAKNARFEQAVMGKADSLVEHYRVVAEESTQLLEQMRAELDEAEAAAAAAKVRTAESTAVSTQTEAAPAPQAYLARAASEGFRKSLSPEDPPSRSEQAAEEQLRASHEATRLFERDVMLKAQSLLQKYSSAAADPRLAGRPRTLPPSVTTSEAPSRSESGSEASPQVCYAVTSAPGAGAGGAGGGGNESSLHPLRRHHLQFEQPPSICDHP